MNLDADFAPPAELAAYIDGRPWETHLDECGGVWQFRDEGQTAPGSQRLPLVLLPGAMGNSDVAWRIASAFRHERRVLSITYPGGMKSYQLAQGLLGLLRARGVGQLALWGSSYGAWWAQAFAAQYPDRTAALWLGNTLVDEQDVASAPLFNLAWLREATPDEVVERWTQAVMQRPDDLLRQLQLFMLHRGLPAAEFQARLRRVAESKPLPVSGSQRHTVICNCEDDAIITLEVQRRVAMRYPRARILSLRSGGHYPHVLVADEVIAEMKTWLDQADLVLNESGSKT